MNAIRTAKTIPVIIVLALFLLWIAPGLIGRDLWKADEPYSFGIVNHIVKTGDWVVPTLTGQPFMEKPPLFYLTAAEFARLFSPWLQLHDASRLATAFYMFITVLFIGLTARELLGREYAGIAMVILIGSTGLQETAHKLITDVAMIAGLSLGLYGLAVSRRRTVLGGILIGAGAGIGFMSKGLLAPGMLGIIALILPVAFTAWRRRTYGYSLLIAFAVALPWFMLWPLALYLRSPELFAEWFWTQNVGRFMSNSLIGQRNSPLYYLTQLPYFALPALPLALWALWHTRRSWRERVDIQLPLIAFLVMLLVLSLSSSIRDIYALPMLLPLTLLAASGVESFPDRAQRAIAWFCTGLFGLTMCVLGFGWIVLISGMPISLAQYLYRMQPDYVPVLNGFQLALACLYALLWLFTVIRFSHTAHFYIINWAVGIVLTWGLLMTLWLPWFEAGSSYRPLFTSLKEHIPARCHTIMSWGLGESERALLEYYTGVLPERFVRREISDCDFVLVQSGSSRVEPPLGPDWNVIWEQSRPREPEKKPKEIFTLLQRTNGRQIAR